MTLLPTLIIYARRVPSLRGAVVETLGHFTGAIFENPEISNKRSRHPLQFLDRNAYTALSYVQDWLNAFRSADNLNVHLCNLVNFADWPRLSRLIKQVPLIVILHSALGDDVSLISRIATRLTNRKGRLVTFVGNEYTQIAAKLDFIKHSGCDVIASQLPLGAARWLYGECTQAAIAHVPAALNPARYYPLNIERTIDVGFRGDKYPLFIGDDERTRLIEKFVHNASRWGLSIDVRFERESGERWHRFLAGCRGTVGAEAGTYYLRRDDALQQRVEAYLQQEPNADFAELKTNVFAHFQSEMSGKAISSRHFEAIGTKTCQLLLEGRYNDVLVPNRHYFEIRKDYANLEQVLEQFRDPAERTRISEDAHAHVLANHTYTHRVASLVEFALNPASER